MTTPAQEREGFEKWARVEHVNLIRDSNDAYITVSAHFGWLAWQARAALDAGAVEALRDVRRYAEVMLHSVPAEGGDELDRIARYSNSTVRHIVAYIDAALAAIPAGSAGEGK